jgi:tRNA (mo5U34)-methyltransferase
MQWPPMATLTGDLAADARDKVLGHPFWYHTIDVAPGVVTPGWFDLREALEQMLLPDVRGKRCLDIGTFDGFFAFELERRGAAEVVATDIEDHSLWDWPPDVRPEAPGALAERHPGMQGSPTGTGFRLIAELIGSDVDWRAVNVYDLDPTEIGRFDVVVCGSLLLHLKDPVRALEAVRAVTRPDGVFVSSEQIEVWTTIFGRGEPLFRLDGNGQYCQWWLANAAGHRRLLQATGFEVTATSAFYLARFNEHPPPARTAKSLIRRTATRLLTGTWAPGVLHRALIARPRR